MKVNEKGYFETTTSSIHPIDKSLGKFLVNYFRFKEGSILDLGCGNGYYTKLLREYGIDCDGYDGNPNTIELTNGMCGIIDLTVPFKLVKKYLTVLCLEVGEHILEKYMNTFIENIHRNNTKQIILSWAIPGQGGYGHVNELSNEIIIETFKDLGYLHNVDLDQKFRDASSLFWFKNTIMIFTKK